MKESIIMKEISEIFGHEEEDVYITDNCYAVAEAKADGNEYSIYKSYDDAEYAALNQLIDEPYFWKEAVKQNSTTAGLDDWAREVIDMDGIISLCSYDGNFEEGDEYIYIRRS